MKTDKSVDQMQSLLREYRDWINSHIHVAEDKGIIACRLVREIDAALESWNKRQPTEQVIDEDCTQEMLKAVAHIPDSKLRYNLAILEDCIEQVDELLDKHEGIEPGYTSMEPTQDRITRLVERQQKDTKRLNWIERNGLQPLFHNRKWFAGSSAPADVEGHNTLREAIDAAIRDLQTRSSEPQSTDSVRQQKTVTEEWNEVKRGMVERIGKSRASSTVTGEEE